MVSQNILKKQKCVFLVGSPRSGTTWLQLLLSQSPAIASATETYLFRSYLRSMFVTWEARKRANSWVGLHRVLTDCEFIELVRGITSDVFQKIIDRKPGASVILEKTPSHALCGKEILSVIPNAYFVHLVRDPRDVVTSILSIAKEHPDGAYYPRHARGATQLWLDHVMGARSIKLLTPNYRELRYRELHDGGPTMLHELFRWLEIDSTIAECEEYFARCEINELRQGRISTTPFDIKTIPGRGSFFRVGKVGTWRGSLSLLDVSAIENMTAQLMAEYGFSASTPKWWGYVYSPIPIVRHHLRTFLAKFI